MEIGLAREHGYELAEDILSHLGKKDWQSGGYPVISAKRERAEKYEIARNAAIEEAEAEGNETSASWISSSRRIIMKYMITAVLLCAAVLSMAGCATPQKVDTNFHQDAPPSAKDVWGYQQNGKAFHTFADTYGEFKFHVYYHRQRRWATWDPYDPKVAYNIHKFDRVWINKKNGWGDMFFEVDRFSKTLTYDPNKQMHFLPVIP